MQYSFAVANFEDKLYIRQGRIYFNWILTNCDYIFYIRMYICRYV